MPLLVEGNSQSILASNVILRNQHSLFPGTEAQPVLFWMLWEIPDKWSLAIDRGYEYLSVLDILSADNLDLQHQKPEFCTLAMFSCAVQIRGNDCRNQGLFVIINNIYNNCV